MKKQLIVITNDDGVFAPGITKLYDYLKDEGDVYIVAPDREKSAVSHSLTLHDPLRIRKIKNKVYSINGTPTDCVVYSIFSKMFKRRPDIVVSGINNGPNLGDDVSYSGTVAASIEAATYGIKSFSISLLLAKKMYWDTACRTALDFLRKLKKTKIPKDMFFNINVPNLPFNRLKGYKTTALARREYKNMLITKKDPRKNPYYWVFGHGINWKTVKGTDYEAVKNNYISITPVKLDMTAHEHLDFTRKFAAKK